MSYSADFTWRRYLLPIDETPDLSDGFLIDPTQYDRAYNSRALAVADAAKYACLVVLGEPGLGKSTVMRNLQEESTKLDRADRVTLAIQLNAYSSDSLLSHDLFDSPHFQEWLSGTHTLALFLDGLDECLLHIRTVATLLATQLARLPVSRLELRIACRTAEWPEVLRQQLRQSYPVVGEFVVAPLTRADAEIAARDRNQDAAAFLQAVEQRDLGPLAARPLTLKFLLASFEGSAQLPDSLVKIYTDGCRLLCTELSKSREASGHAGDTDPDLLLSVAERAAAVTLFGRRSAIAAAADAVLSDDEVRASDLAGYDCAGGVDQFVKSSDVRLMLRTGLFHRRSDAARFVWSHWSYAEFLAARFIARRELTREQQLALLTQTDTDGTLKVTPQLQQTASWLVAMRPDLIDAFVRSDPQMLLRVDLPVGVRPRVTEALLELFAKGELTDFDLSLRQRYEFLRHAGLADQLRPYVSGSHYEPMVRRVAIDIAEATRTTQLLPELTIIALDATESVYTRAQAAYAVNRIGDRVYKRQLAPLLETSKQDDPQLELRGCALHALWPEDISATEMLARIGQPTEIYIGSHSTFLSTQLAAGLSVDDLPVALRWASEQPPEHDSSYEMARVVDAIVARAWLHLEHKEVAQAFARLLVTRAGQHDRIPSRDAAHDHDVDWTNVERRRLLLDVVVPEMVNRVGGEAARTITFETHLVQPGDVMWLLSKATSAEPSEVAEAWAGLVAQALRGGHTWAEWDAALEAASEKDTIARAVGPLLRQSSLDSEEAVFHRSQQIARLERAAREAAVKSERALNDTVDLWLKRAIDGEPSAWWRLTVELTIDVHGRQEGEFHADLTSLRSWSHITTEQREQIATTAETYLRTFDLAVGEWVGSETFHRPALAGYKAIHLLWKMRRTTFDELPQSTWRRWAPAVVTFPERPDVDAREPADAIVCRTYAEAPAAVRETLSTLLKRTAERGDTGVLYRLDACWDAGLSGVALEVLVGELRASSSARRHLAEYSLRSGHVEARTYVERLLSEADGSELTDDQLSVASAYWRAEPRRAWPIIMSLAGTDVESRRQFWLRFAEHADLHIGGALASLTVQELADFYEVLATTFPDSEESSGSGIVSRRDHVARLTRVALQQLKGRGTAEAVQAIRRLSRIVPNGQWLSWEALEAKRSHLELSWEAIAPDLVLRLGCERRARLVTSSTQLLDVVLEALSRLNDRLRGETPQTFAVWEESKRRPKDENRLSDFVKGHLDHDLRGRGIVINREVEITRGDKTDIHVVALRMLPDGSAQRLTTIIEVKGCWHPSVKSSMKTQLADTYLADVAGQSGIYLVGWFLCDYWDPEDSRKMRTPKWTIEEARNAFDAQASALASDVGGVRAFVLDVRIH